jgi:hypothetical protein
VDAIRSGPCAPPRKRALDDRGQKPLAQGAQPDPSIESAAARSHGGALPTKAWLTAPNRPDITEETLRACTLKHP